MVSRTLLQLACLLLLWRPCNGGPTLEIKGGSGGLTLTCPDGDSGTITRLGSTEELSSPLKLEYNDSLSGEYGCSGGEKVYVKFRSCDNCIDLNPTALTSISIADVVATALIGWAVYLIMTRANAGGHASDKKSSDKKRLIPNNNNNRGRGNADDTYQALRPHDTDVYNVLQGGNRR